MSFASASIVHGLSVDPMKLFWTAKAWSDNHLQLAYLDALISGRLQQNTNSRTSLPFEILVVIKQAFLLKAFQLAKCKAWVLFGPLEPTNQQLDRSDNKRFEFHCVAGIKRQQERLTSSGLTDTTCYECGASGERCDCDDSQGPHTRCPTFWWDETYEAKRDAMGCLHGPCRSKACWRCQALRPFLRAFGLHIGDVSDGTDCNYSDVYGCIVSVGKPSRFTASHGDVYTQNTTLEAQLPEFEGMADASSILDSLASVGMLPSCRHPLVNGKARSSSGALQERLTNVDGAPAQCPQTSVSRFHLITTSYNEYGIGEAAVALVFGLSVDPVQLLYYARAFQNNRIQLAYLDALTSGKLQQDPCSRTALPAEIVDMIRHSYWKDAISDNTCEGWALYGDDVSPEFHDPHCCKQAFDQCRAALQRDACELFCDCNGNGLCLCGRVADRLGPYPISFDDFTTGWPYSDDHVYESLWETRDALVKCLGGCQRPHCWTCKALRPYLKTHGIQIGHIADNWSSGTGDSEAISCAISCASTRAIGAKHTHDHNYEMQTSRQGFAIEDVRSMTENAGHLEALAKRRLLPVVQHPFYAMPKKARAAAAGADGLAKQAKETLPKLPVLSTPRFYFSAHSFLE